ncbi:hypothetical protein ABK040_014398 [Willaertia magna]
MKYTVYLILLVCFVACFSYATKISIPRGYIPKDVVPENFKNLQGPPSEFKLHQFPNPSEGAIFSDSTLFSYYLKPSSNGNEYTFEGKIAIDSSDEVIISILALEVDNIQVTILNENGQDITSNAEQVVEPSTFAFSDGEKDLLPSKSLLFKDVSTLIKQNENPKNEWTIQLKTNKANIKKLTEEGCPFYLLTYNESPTQVYSQLQSYDLKVGENIALEARVFDVEENEDYFKKLEENDEGHKGWANKHNLEKGPIPKKEQVLEANLDILLPNGKTETIKMHDDGLKLDIAQNDGIYTAELLASTEGNYVMKTIIRGINTETKKEFIRTTQHLVNVVKDSLQLVNQFSVGFNVAEKNTNNATNEEMITINLLAKPLMKDAINRKYKAYAEVYATDLTTKQLVPVAWVAGMTISKPHDNDLITIPLQMSMKWLAYASLTNVNASKVGLPLAINNAYVQDVATSGLLSILTTPTVKHDIQINYSSNVIKGVDSSKMNMYIHNHPMVLNFDGRLSESMTFGIRPKQFQPDTVKAASNNHKVVLVHGYCSGYTPFTESDFSNYVIFSDPEANRNNDEFARLVLEVSNQFNSVSFVSHSQGGLATLHLVTYYWSKADVSTTKHSNPNFRLLQSVGSPYAGSGLAGILARIGKVFGIGCGVNYDLSYDGAKKWLATIPLSTRQFVYYYTSQYKDYSWCNIASNAVLSWPNDGTTEKKYSSLSGATHVEHTKKQCHTDKMKYPSQCKDPRRNKEINQFAQLN